MAHPTGADADPSAGRDRGDRDRPGDRWRRADWTRLLGGAAVLGVTTVAALGPVSAFEGDVFSAVNRAPDWLYVPVWPVMQLGTVGVAVVVGLAVGLLLRRPVLAVLFAVTPIVAWALAKVVKDLVERGRPAAEGLAVTFRGPLDDGFGFVSGHAAVSFSLATVVTPHLRGWWRVVPYALATTVALARLYVGAHLPLDVIGGAALGVVVGEAARAVEILVVRWRADAVGA